MHEDGHAWDPAGPSNAAVGCLSDLGPLESRKHQDADCISRFPAQRFSEDLCFTDAQQTFCKTPIGLNMTHCIPLLEPKQLGILPSIQTPMDVHSKGAFPSEPERQLWSAAQENPYVATGTTAEGLALIFMMVARAFE